MTTQLSASELQEFEQVLQGYAPGESAIALLNQKDGDLEAVLAQIVVAEAGTGVYGIDGGRLRTVFIKNLRREICGDNSFKTKVEEYSKSPGKAELLTGLIMYLVGMVTLPINPVIATVVVLWVLKLGVRTFCDYTEPDPV